MNRIIINSKSSLSSSSRTLSNLLHHHKYSTGAVVVKHNNNIRRVNHRPYDCQQNFFSSSSLLFQQSIGQHDVSKVEGSSTTTNKNKYMRSFGVVAHCNRSADKCTISDPSNPSKSAVMDQTSSLTPLQFTLGALAGCETSTARFLARQMNLHIGAIHYSKVEGWLDVRGYGKGDTSVPLHFQRVDLVAEIETDATEEQFNILKERVEQQCPVYGLFKASGCHINSTWTIKKFSKE